MSALDAKHDALLARLRALGSVMVAYSGGIDSAYLAWAAHHLRVGGVVLGDNAFAFGEIADGRGAGALRMREFNEELSQGGRFRATMLPTGEGLALGVKIK